MRGQLVGIDGTAGGRIVFVPGGIADVTAPTTAELAQGVDLTDYVIFDETHAFTDYFGEVAHGRIEPSRSRVAIGLPVERPGPVNDIDAAIEGRCACGCGTTITDDSPSAYFATAECQRQWNLRNVDRPEEVRGSISVSPDSMRWRPDMVVADGMRPLRLATGGPDAALCPRGGRYNHTVGVDEQTGEFVMRLDDGNRYVETTVLRDDAREWMATSRDDEITSRWESLNRQMRDSRNLERVDETWTLPRSVIADLFDADGLFDGVSPPLWRTPVMIFDELTTISFTNADGRFET
jgi:hypothetical protein